ncbi:MAG: sigma-70 family RNA polymerase sigma factor [Acidobacteria bacterium]|nr:sigma-70 family RNA polymerase sigma factor [Acidobacteriota bacterium]
MSRIASRDQQALARLYDRHRSLVFALSLRIIRERAEAEEVLGDVFLQVWRQATGYDRSRATVEGWLVNLCRSRAIDRLRARGRREAGAATLAREEEIRPAAAAAESDPAEAVAREEKRVLIAGALAELQPSQREALELAYYGGLSHSEIAEKLAQPLGTVKTHIRQGMMTLRQAIERRFGA